MRALSRLRSWLRAMGRRGRLEHEMAEEMRFHLDAYAADLVASGVPPAEARRRARLEFGAVDARKDEVRQALGLRLVDELRGDVRYALRQLRRAPGFAGVAVLSLGLGIGANTAIVSLMETVRWGPLPVERPGDLRVLWWQSGPERVMNGLSGYGTATADGEYTSTSFSYPVVRELQAHSQAFESLFAFKPVEGLTVLVDGNAEVVSGELVDGRYFDGLRVRPVLGRTLGGIDDVEASEGAAVISDAYWARRFDRDPTVVGRRISVNGAPMAIVGVNPSRFTGVQPGSDPELFLPLSLQPILRPEDGGDPSLLAAPDTWWVLVMGRLRAGVNDAEAQASLNGAFEQAVRATLPDRADRDQPRLVLQQGIRGVDVLSREFSQPLLVLLGLVAVVLLIACANIANLILARAAARQREVSLRLALGAGRSRVARQLLTEGLTLALLGGAAGVVLGYWLRDAIPTLLSPPWRPVPFEATFNWRVVGLALATTTATGVLFSLAPAWRSARTDINSALKGVGRIAGSLPRWWRGKPLVTVQVSLSLVLLVTAGLFLRTVGNLGAVTLGFQPDRVLLFVLNPSQTQYEGERRNAVLGELQERIRAIPGVERATLSSAGLLTGSRSVTGVNPNVGAPPDQYEFAWNLDVGYDFFETMGIPVVLGRSFERADGPGSPRVAVVNQRFAGQFFPDGNPIGEVFRNGARVLRIVGVVGDTKYDELRDDAPPTFYRLYSQEPSNGLGAMVYAVRTPLDATSLAPLLGQAARSVDPALPVLDLRSQNAQIEFMTSQERLFGTLGAAFAVLAMVLAAIGIYGIMANAVARRTHEIGVRIALGARRERVLAMFLRDAMLVTGVGVVAGIAATIGLTRFVQGMLFGIDPLDPATFVAAVAAMLAVALLAGWIPARRAARLEPMQALRHE